MSPSLILHKLPKFYIPEIFKGPENVDYRNILDASFPYDLMFFKGGRGGAKTQTFAQLAAGIAKSKKVRILCARQLLSSIESSFHQELKAAIERAGWDKKFNITKISLEGLNGSQFIFKGLARNSAEIKGISGINLVIVDEAQDLSKESIDFLVPTIRAKNARIIFLWNPRYETDYIEIYSKLQMSNPRALIQDVQWYDNPFFPEFLERQRLFAKKELPRHEYEWVWEGKFQSNGGAYFMEGKLLSNRLPVEAQYPRSIFMTIDTTLKGGTSRDGTGIAYVAFCPSLHNENSMGTFVTLDWDLLETSGDMLDEILPSFIQKGMRIARTFPGCAFACYVEDKAAGAVILNKLKRKGLPVIATPSRLTAMGKDGKAVALSEYVNQGKIKMSRQAFDKEVAFHGITQNHLLAQIRNFKPGDPKANTRSDDSVDAWMDANLLAMGGY